MKRTAVFVTLFAAAIAVSPLLGLHATSALAQDMGEGASQTKSGMGMGMMGKKDKGKPGGGMMDRGMGGMMGGRCPKMGMMGGGDMHAKGRVAFLKAELEITDAQQDVWNTYAEALKKNMQSMQDAHKSMMKAKMAQSPVEKVDARITMMESRVAALKEIKPALAALYGSLSDDQKKKAGQLLIRMGCMM